MHRCSLPLLRVSVLAWTITAGLTAQRDERQDPRTLEQFLREIAPAYDISSLFRFDPPGEPTKEPMFNQPETLGFAIERRIERLPRQGKAATVPWSGWWWPMRQEGTAAGGIESPVAKYARAFGLADAPLAWEREHHGTAGAQQPEAWWGHCNGWAAAAILEPMPQGPVQSGDVTFAPLDLAALLTEVYYGCRAIGLDERYAGVDKPAVDQFGRATDRAYRDANPAVLHLLACNRIGVEGKAMVADISPGAEVWNHPLWAFEIRELKELADGAAAVLAITGKPFSGAYPFHDRAKRWFAVHARFRVALALRGPGAPVDSGADAQHSWLEYRYVLETDAEGRILGGEWVGDSRLQHPDFVWVPLTPTSSYSVTSDGRCLVGTTGLGNPYVVYEEVRALLRLSVSGLAAASDQGPGRWSRPSGGAEPRWTRTFQVAHSQVQRAQVQQAIATLSRPLQQALAGDAQVPPAVQQELRLRRGWLHFVNQDVRQAIADYDGLPADGTLSPTVRARRALFLVARGDSVRALAEAAQAIAANPDNPWGYCARAWVYLSRRADQDEARAAVDLARAQALGADPFVAFSGLQIRQSAPPATQQPQVDPRRAFQAQIEAMPAQLGRLFAGQVSGVQLQQQVK